MSSSLWMLSSCVKETLSTTSGKVSTAPKQTLDKIERRLDTFGMDS